MIEPAFARRGHDVLIVIFILLVIFFLILIFILILLNSDIQNARSPAGTQSGG